MRIGAPGNPRLPFKGHQTQVTCHENADCSCDRNPRDTLFHVRPVRRLPQVRRRRRRIPGQGPQHKPITFTKPIDKASPILARALANGTHLTNVTLKQDGHVTVLKSARVVSIEQDAAGNEVVTLAPAAGEAEARKSKGKVEATWKVEEGTR